METVSQSAGLPTPPTSPAANSAVPVWPRSAQWVAALLLLLALILMAGHLVSMSSLATRPTEAFLRLDPNRADLAELRQLPGIGDVLARRIEEHRRENGAFSSVDDLRRVKGIGPATLEILRPFLHVERATSEIATDSVPAEFVPPAHDRQPVESDTLPIAVKKRPVTNLIDLNRATVEDLRKLPGVGPKISERIINARNNGAFESVDDLRRVPGIGPKTLERLRPFLTVTGPAEKASLAP